MKTLRFSISAIIVLLLLSGCKILKPEKYYTKAQQEHAPFDAVIVPGVPFEDSTWSYTMRLRVYWAKYLLDQGVTKNIIMSGGAVYTKYSECHIMRLYALEMGIPEENIFLDSLAEHSTENVYYGYYLAKYNGFSKIAVATDPFQAKMVKAFSKKMRRRLDADIQLLPALMDTVLAMPKPPYDIPYEEAIGVNFINIVETQGNWHRLKGTIGLNVDWKNPPYQK